MDSRTLCLAVLMQGEASGYEIKKTLEDAPYSHFQDTGFGSIYPALTRLTEEGQAEFREMAQEKRPDKKVYSITEAGRQALVEALMVPPGLDKYRSDFLFVLFLGGLLPGAHLAAVVDQRIAYYEAQIDEMADCAYHTGGGGPGVVHGFGLAIYQAAADYLKRHRDDVIASSADGSAERAVAE